MAQNDYVLDTNVLIHANGDKSEQTSPECKAACVRLLFAIMAEKHRIVLDGGGDQKTSRILEEYRNNMLDTSGLGELFFQWILNSWSNHFEVVHVPLTPKDETFEEFPDDKRLAKFDPRDRKWIATARAHHMYNDIQAKVIQSADFKWQDEGFTKIFAELTEHPVQVEFICAKKK